MVSNLGRDISEKKPSIVLLILFLVFLIDLLFDFSTVFPDGVFSLIYGVLMLIGGIILYRSNTDS